MFLKCFLHVGTEKTGTKTIQEFLAINRDALADRGVRFPHIFGDKNNLKLAAYAQNQTKIDDVRKLFGVTNSSQVALFRSDLERLTEERFRRAEFANDTAVLSNEHLHSRLSTPDEVETLKSLVQRLSSNIKVIIYLRRQDRVAVSLYSTRFKSGGTELGNIFPQVSGSLEYFYDYDRILNNYEQVFGKQNIIVRIFSRKNFKDGDLLSDFLELIGIPSPEGFVIPESKNESIVPIAQHFLAEINRHVPKFIGSTPNTLRGGLDEIVSHHYAGSGQKPPRREAEEFYKHFRPGNARIAERYFGSADRPLFDEDFSEYPDQVSEPSFTFEQAVEISAQLWNERSRQFHSEKSKRFVLQGELALLEKRFQVAEPAFKQAIAFDTRSALAHKKLSEVLAKQKRFEPAIANAEMAVKLEPRNAAYQLDLANLLIACRRRKKAIPILEELIEQEPGHDAALRRLSEIHLAIEQVEPASDYARRALEINPDEVRTLALLGVLYIRQNDYENAETCLKKALALTPEDAALHRNLSEALFRQQRREEAIASAKAAINLKPRKPDLQEWLASISPEDAPPERSLAKA